MSTYAVIGNPIAHSKSPLIHRLFAEQTGQEIQYDAKQIEADDFESFVEEFFESGGAGLNVTVPYKEKAFAMAEHKSERASLALAANTLYINEAKQLCADNTDGIGLLRDVRDNHAFDLNQKKILLLGAGGAVRGVLAVLVSVGSSKIHIANRTEEKAVQLVKEFDQFAHIEASSLTEIPEDKYDLIINGTSLGLTDEAPAVSSAILAANSMCYDMMYGTNDTAFVRWAKQRGVTRAIDGLGMLVEQAAESFSIWRGVKPDTKSVISQLRGGLESSLE